ncbi:MAG: hypothetical protein U0V73_07050 [Acidimicrobiia bacterium]
MTAETGVPMRSTKRQTELERVLAFVALGWAVAGAWVALPAIPESTPSGRGLVLTASIVGPLAAVGASFAMRARRTAWAVALLVVSLVTPVYFWWPLYLVPLVLIVLVVATRAKAGDPGRGERSRRAGRAR